MFFGNLFVYYQFQGKDHIDEDTRRIVFTALIAVAVLGVIFLGTLQRVNHPFLDNGSPDSELDYTAESASIVGAFKSAIKLFLTKDMLLLNITFLYTGAAEYYIFTIFLSMLMSFPILFFLGFELSFFSGVYSSSIGFTLAIGESAKRLVGLSGICIGVGEVFGGILFGLLGSKTVKYGRDPIVITGFVIHLLGFLLIFMNLPDEAPFQDTKALGFFNPPLASVALLCSFLLGFGDACFNTQIYSMLGGVFADNSAAAFALFKFTQVIYDKNLILSIL